MGEQNAIWGSGEELKTPGRGLRGERGGGREGVAGEERSELRGSCGREGGGE